jgi:uncharacterized protein (DUF433 family)
MSDVAYGMGAYSLAEAGRLLRVPPATLRHWLFGYGYSHHGPRVQQQPLWKPEYGVNQEEPLLGFRDLLEARVVRGFREKGIGLPTIRQCLNYARELVDDDHPFSTRQFKSDGRRMFLESKDGRILDLKLRQHVFRDVVEPTFVDLDYEADTASRWWLLPKKRTIAIDPERSFGQPIEVETGVPTLRLAQAFAAEGSVDRVANLYEIRPAVVRDALMFERRRMEKLAA